MGVSQAMEQTVIINNKQLTVNILIYYAKITEFVFVTNLL